MRVNLWLISLFLWAVFLFISCVTVPKEALEEPSVEKPLLLTELDPIPEDSAIVQEEVILYEVIPDIYEKTFSEIEIFTKLLSSVIAKQQFNRWITYLSAHYRKIYSSPEKLQEVSNYPQLREQNIVLNTIQDYFTWVVVPSRSQAVLDDIVFVDANKVIAYSSYQGIRAKLYELEKVNKNWKVTVW